MDKGFFSLLFGSFVLGFFGIIWGWVFFLGFFRFGFFGFFFFEGFFKEAKHIEVGSCHLFCSLCLRKPSFVDFCQV